MTVDATTSTPGSGAYRAIRTPPPALGAALPVAGFAGVPCAVIRAALVEDALAIADEAKRLRWRNGRTAVAAAAWLAARGVSPTAAPRP